MNLRDKMLAVMSDVNEEVAEREELVATIATALLTRKNLFILGDPGQAKSYAINAFRRRITGARQFERLLSKQTDEDQLFGRIDLSSLIPGSVPQSVLDNDTTYKALRAELEEIMQKLPRYPDDEESMAPVKQLTERLECYRQGLAAIRSGEPTVLTAGKIPEADIVFLDECFKCNDGVLNSLLTALNERKYTNEGRTYPIPTISFFAASNEIPNFNDPQEKILAALYDRLELKIVTENIGDREKRLGVLRQKQRGGASGTGATFTLNELKAMQAEVAGIPVPDAVNELADDILCELRKSGVTVSDRKYLNYYPIAQAKAWLDRHTAVEPKDLLALRCYLWEKPGDLAQVDAILNRMCINPMQDKVNDIRAMAADVLEDFNTAKDAAGSRALIKFRGEYIRLYGMYEALLKKAEGDSEKAMLADLLSDLERDSKAAHETVGFTYTPLEQLAALNN